MAKIHNFGGDYALHHGTKKTKSDASTGVSESVQPERADRGHDEAGYFDEEENSEEIPSTSSKKASKKKK